MNAFQDEQNHTKRRVYDQLKQVVEPSFNINVVDLGLIYQVEIKADNIVQISFSLVDLGDPNVQWVNQMQALVEKVPGIGGVDLELATSPVWSRSKMSKAAAQQSGLIYFGACHE